MKYRIFIVEDDETIANLLKKHLSSWGYDVFLAEDFSNILQEFAGKDPQLVLLDLKLPFYNGFHWCEEIRKVSQVPVIFISSAADNMNMVMAMSRGADDFIAKPFDMDVLVAKIQAILRRTYSFGNPGNVLEHKGAVLNLSRATLTWNGEETELTRNELRILELLFSQAGKPVSRDAIMTKLWESDSFVDDNTLTVNITRLRKKLEAAVYLAVLWLGAGAAVFLYGYACYRQKVQNLILVEKAPEINLGRLGETTDEVELLYRDIIRKLDGMRMGAETERQRSLEEMTDYYTMWAHQIKTPIFALRLLIREEPEENRESLAQLFRIEQYVEMVLGYLRTEDMSADLKLTRCSLDRIIREQIHKYAGIFVSKKLSLSYEGTDAIVLTDEKWLGFVIGQILSNALKYTRTGGIEIWLEDERGNRVSENPNLKQNTAPGICNTAPATLVIADSGIGIQPEDLPRIFEKGYTGVNGREDNRATGIGLYLSRKILRKLGHEITVDSQVDKGTEVRMSLWKKDLEMY